ncbi:MAG: hypothetical protein JW749_06275 [Sedimentisphaerales bacterium]|nr:hypothetical protein [Sedimentisphaerales bacterium]
MKKAVLTFFVFIVSIPLFADNVIAAEYVRTYQVSAGADDGYSSGSTAQNISGLLIIGDGGVSAPYYMSAMRFRNVDIPRSALVTSATLKIQSTDTGLSGNVYGQIRSEASDDAADFSSRYIASTPLNSATLNWDHTSTWAANTLYTSPNISTVLQPVLNRTGWYRGNDLAILYRTRSNSNRTRSFVSFDTAPANAPVLEVTYQNFRIWGHVRTYEGTPVEGVSFTVPHSDVEPTLSDVNGYYELLVPPLWADRLDISKTGWYIYPDALIFSETTSDWNNIDIQAFQPHITGYVKKDTGAALAGIQIIADGGYSGVTDADGHFDVRVPYEWTGTIRPVNSEWLFTPGNRWLSYVTTNIAGIDFTGFQPTISGRITNQSGNPRQNVQVTTSDGRVSVLTGPGGDYSFSVPYHWSGRVTPNLSQWGFIPTGRDYNDLTASQANQDFTVFKPRIKGTVASENGEPIEHAGIRMDGYLWTYTDSNGRYEFPVEYGWSGIMEPLLDSWAFEPNQRTYTNVTSDLNNQDYTGRSVFISGYVKDRFGNPITGTITYHVSDNLYYFISRDDGSYRVRVPYNWSGTVTPSLNNFGLIPPNKSYTNVISEITDQNYIAFQPIIRGHITMLSGGPAIGVTVSAGASTTTDTNGFYEIKTSYGWSGTITPNKTGLFFKPPNNIYSNITADQNGQDYITNTNPYGLGSGTPEDPYQIATAESLNTIGSHPEDFNKCFLLTADIDLVQYSGSQFKIIGSSSNPFTGVFDGNGHTISNFKYAASGTTYIGLFGYGSGANCLIKNIILAEPNVTGFSRIGALIGYLTAATVENCSANNVFVLGTDTYSYTGGLVGYQYSGSIINCNTSGSVTGVSYLGGLVGRSGGVIDLCHSSCAVKGATGGDRIGGLAGQSAAISRSFSTGNVQGSGFYTGGLSGYNNGTITSCYSTADVNGTNYVGGLTGQGGVITDCYARGTVSGTVGVGGLVGRMGTADNIITRAYSSGLVNGTETEIGGLVGYDLAGSVNYGYWDINSSGQTISAGGIGKTTAQMKSASAYIGWQSDPCAWNIQDGVDYPHLLWEGLPGEPIFNQWYEGGSGNVNDPYLISTAQHLAAVGRIPDDWGKHFRLDADIDCSEFEDEFQPIGNSSAQFTGVFDGAGHTISNLIINTGSANYAGLFGYISGGQVSCFGLVNPIISGGDYVGAIAGRNSGTLTQCWVRGGSVSGDEYVGGLVGYNAYSIKNCYTQADTTGNLYIGGLIGQNYGSVINCYSTGTVTGTESVGGFAGYNNGSIQGCFWDIETSGQATSYGGTGKTTQQMKNADTFAGWGCNELAWTIDNGNDYPRVLCENAPGEPIDASLSDYLQGSGTAEDPYLVSDAAALNLIGQFDCEWGKHFKQTANIDMRYIAGDDYHIIGTYENPFTGVFDGNNYNIYNISCAANSNYVGLFGYVSDANSRLTNITLVNPNIDGGSSNYVGALAGAVFQGNVTGCSVRWGNITSEGDFVGGLIGRCIGTEFSDCHAKTNVNGRSTVGGLAGDISSLLVLNCSAECSVSGQLDNIGGFGGRVNLAPGDSQLVNCYSSGSVAGNNVVGGFTGTLLGREFVNIVDCHSDSAIAGKDYVGGFAGRLRLMFGSVIGCTAAVEINATGNYVGGFAGVNDSNIINCEVWGNVAGLDMVGGIVGNAANYSQIKASHFTGTVAGTTQVGGIVGYNQPTSGPGYSITSSYAEGQVTGQTDVGGLAGRNSTSRQIVNSYASCEISGAKNVGGLVGFSTSYPPANCVWDVEKSDLNNWCGYGACYESSFNRGRTTEQMKSAYSFAGWVCDANWLIEDGQNPPHLSWESQQGQPIMPLIYPQGTGGQNDPFLISNPQQLLAIGWANCLFKQNFALTTDLDFSDYNLADYRPIGTNPQQEPAPAYSGCFNGTFDGQGHIISDFNFRPAYTNREYKYLGNGLFGCVGDANAQVKNLGLVRPDINILPPLQGSPDCGPLIGYLYAGTISQCFSRDGNVAGMYGIGGLVGRLGSANAKIMDSYSTTKVVALSSYAGGLAGYNYGGTIQRCYSAGNVSGPSSSGGLVGYGNGAVNASFWDVNTSGQATSAGGTGLTTEQMKTYLYFADAGWDFNNVWRICEPVNYPKLLWQVPVSDFLCPDGVDFIDYSFLTEHWLQTDYGNCNGLDITGNGKVDLAEFTILAGYWGQGNCGNCAGIDYSGDGKVDSDDLIILCENWLATDYGDVEGAEISGDGLVDLNDLMLFADEWLDGLSD